MSRKRVATVCPETIRAIWSEVTVAMAPLWAQSRTSSRAAVWPPHPRSPQGLVDKLVDNPPDGVENLWRLVDTGRVASRRGRWGARQPRRDLYAKPSSGRVASLGPRVRTAR